MSLAYGWAIRKASIAGCRCLMKSNPWRSGYRLYLDGWCKRTRGWSKVHLQECCRATLHRAFDPQLPEKYVPSKDYKAFTAQLKKIYGAVNLKAAQAEFERFCDAWSKYQGAIRVEGQLPAR